MSLVKVKNLTISFKQYDSIVNAVRGISFEINQGESSVAVGESGSGKSVTFMTVMGLMNSPTSIVESDLIEIDGINLIGIDDNQTENSKIDFANKLCDNNLFNLFVCHNTLLNKRNQVSNSLQKNYHLSYAFGIDKVLN